METLPSSTLWPLGLFLVAVLAVVISMLAFSFVLGQRHKGRVTDEPYESGMPPTGTAGLRFPVKYYQVAVFFVIFDVEALFIFSWAVAARELGWPGYVEAVVFIGILLVALFYLGKLGALDWGTSKERRPL